MIRYIFKGDIDNYKIKIEIGKRYNLKKGIYIYETITDIINFVDIFPKKSKIYKAKIYSNFFDSIAEDFKIIEEINYSKLLNSINKKEQLISAVKNRETKFLDKMINSDIFSNIQTVINSGIEEYLDKILDKYNEGYAINIIKKYGRNKDLDKFISSNNYRIQCEIAKIGRPQDLDILINNKNIYVVEDVIKNGRTKDIDKYINHDIHFTTIVSTGIDKYLDKFIKEDKEYLDAYYFAKVGRLKDLDYLIKNYKKIPENVLKLILEKGYEKHEDFLKNKISIK